MPKTKTDSSSKLKIAETKLIRIGHREKQRRLSKTAVAHNISRKLTDPLIDVKNINVFYGTKHVLKDINIRIISGKITALIGPSGCGKSTLLNCLNRLNDLNPNCKVTGQILVKNKEINNKEYNPMLLRLQIGMVFQKAHPFPMSIYENVIYGPWSKGIRNKKELDAICRESLTEAALWDEVKDNLEMSGLSLSGGQQQRLCIARCIAMKPEIILMDEPTSALDPIATAKIEQLIFKLKKQYTIIIVTHSMSQAARISDYTALLWLGKIVEYDRTKAIFSRPKKQITDDYITGKQG